ncbi:MAG: protoheme IX farnesyltransferase [Dehalococcoidaceae bacterium]|nr:protoheme IX farnesyltransferase [Dehalococcoidaceae bacterium]
MDRIAPSIANLSTWRDYAGLTKPRVVILLLLTTIVAMWLAAGRELNWSVVAWTALGGYLSAGGAGAINCYLDRDIDERMARTCRRAIPAGRLAPPRALLFGISLALLSLVVLWYGTNALAALLSLIGLLYYVVVYTWWLKRRTVHNIVIGGVAGALPPLVGWTAAVGGPEPMAWVLAGIVLAWTPPHFWALALLRRDEYASAGVPVLPVERGEQITRRFIVGWTALTVMLSFLPLATSIWKYAGVPPNRAIYAAVAALLGGAFLAGSLLLMLRGGNTVTRWFYIFTIVYLGLLLLSMAAILGPY